MYTRPPHLHIIHKVVILCVGLHYIELFVTLIHVYTCPMKGELWSVCWLHFDRHQIIFYAILRLEDTLKETATLRISMFYQKELYEPWILIQVSSKSVENGQVMGI